MSGSSITLKKNNASKNTTDVPCVFKLNLLDDTQFR